MKTVRDERVGAALRQLETPEHRPSFHAELERLLAAEAAERRPVRRLRPRPRLRWGLRVAIVAVVAALAVVVVDLLRSGDAPGPGIGVQQATAAEIQAQVRSVFAGLQTVSGEFSAEGETYENAYGWESRRWRFILAENGDFGLTGVGHEENLSYNARRGVRRTLNPSESLGTDDLFAHVARGVAPGPPDSYPPESILQKDYAALVRAFLAAEDPRVVVTEYAGRPAWRLDVKVQVNRVIPEYSGDEFSIWVDQETGIPVRIVERKNGRTRNELRIENLALDAPGARVRPVRFPPGMEVTRSNEGFRRTSLDGVQQIVGYAPLVPAWLPEGFELAEVAAGPGEVGITGVEGSNPPSTDVVSLSFRRGFDQILVTTRLRNVPGYPQEWTDPLATGEGFLDRSEQVELGRGALSGVEANLLVVPRNIPHLWAQTDDLVVTVSGNLSREELLRVAESLEPRT